MALTEIKTPCWLVECDICGEGDNREHGGSFHYGSRDEAVKEMGMYDWMLHDDGIVECDECHYQRADAVKDES